MKYLLCARHGSYDLRTNGSLDEKGRRQINQLVDCFLHEIPENSTIDVVTSGAKRAIESGEIFNERLKLVLPPENLFYLWYALDIKSDKRYETEPSYHKDNDYKKLYELIQERESRADALVLITHGGFASHLHYVYMKKKFGKDVADVYTSTGTGILIDTLKKTSKRIP